MGCKTKAESCILKDDLTPVYEEIRQADVVLFGLPGLLRRFFRTIKIRLRSFDANPNPDFSSRLPAGKQAIFVLTQGVNPDPEQFKDIFKRYETFMKWLNFDTCLLLRACGLQGPGEVKDRPEALRGGRRTCRRLYGRRLINVSKVIMFINHNEAWKQADVLELPIAYSLLPKACFHISCPGTQGKTIRFTAVL